VLTTELASLQDGLDLARKEKEASAHEVSVLTTELASLQDGLDLARKEKEASMKLATDDVTNLRNQLANSNKGLDLVRADVFNLTTRLEQAQKTIENHQNARMVEGFTSVQKLLVAEGINRETREEIASLLKELTYLRTVISLLQSERVYDAEAAARRLNDFMIAVREKMWQWMQSHSSPVHVTKNVIRVIREEPKIIYVKESPWACCFGNSSKKEKEKEEKAIREKKEAQAAMDQLTPARGAHNSDDDDIFGMLDRMQKKELAIISEQSRQAREGKNKSHAEVGEIAVKNILRDHDHCPVCEHALVVEENVPCCFCCG
jgi:hypothetical protein